MINYKNWNLDTLGSVLVLGIVVVFFIAIVMMFIAPILGVLVPSVFTASLSLTDTLLFLILMRLYISG